MAVEDAVELLALYVQDNGETMGRRYGPEAVAAAGDMAALISSRLEAKSAHVGLWAEFERAPYDNMEQLTGTLEAHIEADPSLARILSAYLGEIRGTMASPEVEEPSTEQPIAAPEGDALDDAVSLDTDEIEQDRRSYHPEGMGSGTEYDASVDRGSYLYGEVAAGRDTVGQEVGVEPVDLVDPDTRPTELAALNNVSGLFELLRMAVEDHPVLDNVQRREVLIELGALEERIQGPEAADSARLRRHIERLQELAPDVAETTIEALAALELPPSTQKAVEQLRARPPEEGQTTE
jgi:hypothetical protein